jgi:hypothetical protein
MFPVSTGPGVTGYFEVVAFASTAASVGSKVTFVLRVTLSTGVGVTRTQGFWATHLDLLKTTWAAYIAAHPGGATICGVTITTAQEAMGGLWASVSQTSTGGKRGLPYQSEMVLVQQWIAALLNAQAFGTSDGGLLANGAAACNSGNQSAITNAAEALDNFNNSGDLLTSPFPTGSATPQSAQAFADIRFWDVV